MSERGEQNLMQARRSELAVVGGANPLVARGLSELVQPHQPLVWEFLVEIPGTLVAWLSPLETEWHWTSPGKLIIDLQKLMQSEKVKEEIEERIADRARRLDKLISLEAPEVVIRNEKRMLGREEQLRQAASNPRLWSFQFKAEERVARIASCAHPDKAVEQLCQFKELEVLDLDGLPVGNNGVSAIRSLTRLFKLSLNCTNATEDGLAWLPTLTRLEKLELAGCSVTDELLKRIAPLKQLTLLNLTACRITDQGLSQLHSFPWLRDLRVGKDNVYYRSGLWSGSASSNEITDDGLAYMAQLSQLEELELVGCGVTDRGIAHLSDLRALKQIDLNRTQVTGAGLKHFTGVANFQRLFLSDCPFTDEGLFHLRDQSNLNELHLDGTRITDAGIGQLSNLNKLDTLVLSSTSVTDRGLQALRGLSSLKDLSLNWCPGITFAGIESLEESLPNCEISHSCTI